MSDSGIGEEALKTLKLVNLDDEAMAVVSHRVLESDRRAVMASAIPVLANSSTKAVAIVAKGPSDDVREFIAAEEAGSGLHLLEVTCKITFEDLSPSECVEYSFPEEPGTWRLALVSRGAVESYRAMKFRAWKDMLSHPTCEAQFRRMLASGVVTQVYDAVVFPSPEEIRHKYQVVDEKNGKIVELPHPVSGLRVWDPAASRYEAIDTQLVGAPPQAEVADWWNTFLQELGQTLGESYLASLRQSTLS